MKRIELFPDMQIIFNLYWDYDIDLDLALFYHAKNGDAKGVFAREYTNGRESEGSLEAFPFIKYNIVCTPDSVEQIVVRSLNEMKTIHVCVINYEGCIEGEKTNYSMFKGKIDIITDEKIINSIPINNSDVGDIYVSFRIVLENNQYWLEEMNNILSLNEAYCSIPGFSDIVEGGD